MINVFQNRPFNLTNGVMSCICPQNGVLEGGTHCHRVDTPLTMPASLDSHNGNVSSNGGQSRPKILDVNPTKGYKPKHVFGGVGDTDEQEGSLPCTPELESDSELDVVSPAGNEALDNETTQLISLFLRVYTGLSTRRWNQKNEPLDTMKRVVDGVLEKHKYAYNGMITKLSLDDRGDDASFVSAVAKSLFGDGTTNWGRVVSLVAFGAVVSQYLKEKSRRELRGAGGEGDLHVPVDGAARLAGQEQLLGRIRRVLSSSGPRVDSEEHTHGLCWICWYRGNTGPVDQVNLLDSETFFFFFFYSWSNIFFDFTRRTL
ncbi:Induced myeloid leukemia cell differentiation protein [Collichthys lucidus]|uniref:Induced myeloid leukemia cell differentiation protein n=1 Tax=Collichthys lucidus TaxID=240159 RepID=A0A4U5V465_COLLU|nr:Induced myeloid leukemia cell differentiation protein [Collichthys lucidus]